MDTKKITRLMIDTAVKRGIENMTDDPRRSIRKLADMGKQFSTGRFQSEIIGIIQTLLANENSPYYALLEDSLTHTDHDLIRKFGINMGYNSWTYDARILRSKSEELGIALPWCLLFHYDADLENGLTPAIIRNVIAEAKPLGINSFGILQKGGKVASNDIIDIFKDNEECGFFYFLENVQLTTSQIMTLKKCGNTLISIDADDKDSNDICTILRDNKLLYSIYHFYTEDDIEKEKDPQIVENYLNHNAGMLFLIQRRSCPVNYGELVKKIRMEGAYPCFLWDIYYDIALTSQILVGTKDSLLEIDPDGAIYTTKETGLNITTTGLMDILKTSMPVYKKEL